nr:retrovirus-related Pol polyprotein from transposon TNT 1-94 [Tanacetum cinerariifolium]
MPPKRDLVIHDAPLASETVTNVVHVESSTNKTSKEISKTLRRDAPIIEVWTPDFEDESEHESVSNQKEPSFVQTFEQVKTPRPSVTTVKDPKQARNLRIDNQKSRSQGQSNMRVNHHNSARMNHPHSNRHVVPTTALTRSRLVPFNVVRPVTTDVPKSTVKSPRPVKHVANKAYTPIRRHIHLRPAHRNSNFNQKVTTVKVKKVNVVKGNPQQVLKDKGVIDSGCSRYMTGNISYLLNFEEINGGYVAFCGNPKGGKITSKDTECVVLSFDFKLPDENHVLLRVLIENNMYNVDLKNVVPSGDLNCLFAKDTLDESNLWHRRLGYINFKTINKLVKDPLGKFDGKADEGFFIGYSVNSKAFRVFKSRTRIVLETLHINFLENQPNVTRSGPKWLFDIDTLTQSMNYQPVVAGNQPNHSVDVDASFDVKENENEVHVSPSSSDKPKIHDEKAKRKAKGKNMPALEDIVYLDDEEDVAPQTRSMERMVKEQGGLNQIYDEDFHTYLHKGKRAIGSKWVFRNKKDEREIVIRNKARLVAQGHTKEEGIDYEEVFAPVARIEAIWLFLAYASFMGFKVYQMDVKSAFLYGTIKEKVYVCQPLGIEERDYLDKVYNVVKALYGLHQAPRAWYETLANYLLENDGKSASTPIDTEKPLLKDLDGDDVDVHIYRSMIGSLMYLTSSRLDIMFVVCACARLQVTPKASHLHAVKRIFRYLKGKPHLGLWYPKDSPFNLVAYSDSDYAGSSLDRKSTTEGCQFLCCRLISWQCKKHTVVATSSAEAKHVAATSYCAQVLWIQNQLLDYGHFNTAVSYKLMLFGLTKDVVHLMLLDDADGVECLPTEEIFAELTRMGYEKPPLKLTFYKAFFSAQWKFLIHILVQCMSAKKTAWNQFSCSMASAVICLAIGRKFNVSKYILDSMVRNVDSSSKFLMYLRFLQVLINNQVDDVSSHTTKYTSPTLTQKVFANMRRIAQPAPPSSPPQEQPTTTSTSDMTLLNTLLETCTTLSHEVAALEQDKVAQALEIIKLKQRVKRLEKKMSSKSFSFKRLKKVDADEDITLVDMETEVKLDVELQGRVERKDDDNDAAKEVNAAEPTVFDDEEVTMTMAQTLIKMKAEKPRFLDEQMAKRLHDEEVKQAAAREKQEQDDFKRAQELQQLYQSLKRKPISVAQARKNMIVYLKNMAGYKIEHFKGMIYDQVRPIFKREYNKVQTFLKPDKDEEPAKKRVTKETLLQESFKKLRA